jgi:hypothetical protein
MKGPVGTRVRSTVVRLVMVWFIVAGCASANDEPAAVDLLPNTLGGVHLVKESFSGSVWLITATERETLLRSFMQAIGDVRATKRHIVGKEVTVTTSGLPARRGYLYARRDTLFVAGTDHLDPGEIDELMSKLPGP